VQATPPETADPSPWLDTLRSLVAIVDASDAHEVEIRMGPLRIRLRRALRSAETVAALPAAPPSAPAVDPRLHAVRCPVTGIWYDAPSPGAPPYVQRGEVIGVGAIVGLVETMKVFNEVTSDAAGTVLEVLAQRGDLIQANAPVLMLQPLESDPAVSPGG